MISLYVLDVPENQPVVDVAGRAVDVHVGKCGPYFEIRSSGPMTIDRRATGCRHAVWYSCIAGVASGRITQWDKDCLLINADAGGPPLN